MFDSPHTRRRLTYSVAAFFAVWIPGSALLGLDWGRRLRFGGDDPNHAAPVIEGILNMAAVMLAPAMLAGLLVFAMHAWWTERHGS